MPERQFDAQLSRFRTRDEFIHEFRFPPEKLAECWKDYNKWEKVWLQEKIIKGVRHYAIFTSED